MPTPHEQIAAVHAAHERLHHALAGLDDATAARASLLPDWTVGHVVTHLARNADSVVRRLRAAMNGELVSQYEGGAPARAKAIEDGARRPSAALLEDLHTADRTVDELLGEVPDEVWDRTVLTGAGDEVPATQLTLGRWREVETHHADLGFGYTAADWPQGLVDVWLPELLGGLPGRSDQRALMAWLLGRGVAPDLGPWG